MSVRNVSILSAGAIAAALALVPPASAMTLPGPSQQTTLASSQLDKVYWRGGGGWHGGGWRGGGWRGGGWRGGGWGWGPGAIVGGLAAGALIGGYYGGYYGPYYGYGNCWRDGWDRLRCY
jgi:hypothetical protein